jgi:1,4-dihydroxy-2-naphthoyl-CoA hydrolase
MIFKRINLQEINAFNKGTLMEHLGIECIEIGEDYLVATMPVNEKTKQPMGLLHGGANAALIESIASMGSACILDLSEQVPVGLEINANHVGSAKSGFVKGIGKIVHAGRTTHVWQVDIYEVSSSKHLCTGRLTVLVKNKN